MRGGWEGGVCRRGKYILASGEISFPLHVKVLTVPYPLRCRGPREPKEEGEGFMKTLELIIQCEDAQCSVYEIF